MGSPANHLLQDSVPTSLLICHTPRTISFQRGKTCPVQSSVLLTGNALCRLGVFYKNLPAREYKFLISEPDFTYKTLHRLLVNNELKALPAERESLLNLLRRTVKLRHQ